MHRVLGINKGKNNCNFEKERCVIFFNFAGAIVEGDSAKSSIVFRFKEYEIFYYLKLTQYYIVLPVLCIYKLIPRFVFIFLDLISEIMYPVI